MEPGRYKEITEKLKTALNEMRYIHTLGVAYTAAAMAMRYAEDPDRALLAGLLHDCAKCFPDAEKFELCREGGIELSDIEIRNTALIHAKLGEYIARRDYGVEDQDILDAIRTHTTGAPGMSDLQKIIYLADLIEPGRSAKVIPGLKEMREMAFADLDECVYMVTRQQVDYLKTCGGKEIDPATLETFYYYRDIHEGRTAGNINI